MPLIHSCQTSGVAPVILYGLPAISSYIGCSSLKPCYRMLASPLLHCSLALRAQYCLLSGLVCSLLNVGTNMVLCRLLIFSHQTIQARKITIRAGSFAGTEAEKMSVKMGSTAGRGGQRGRLRMVRVRFIVLQLHQDALRLEHAWIRN